MRAMVLPRFGDPDLFELREVEKPKPGPGEVLVRVLASAVNPVDAKLRANGSWANLKPPVILGYDVAGVVEELGAGVLDFNLGDEVYYMPEISAILAAATRSTTSRRCRSSRASRAVSRLSKRARSRWPEAQLGKRSFAGSKFAPVKRC